MMVNNSLLKRSSPLILQSLGAHRKPRWLPVAKSKIYRIPKRPVVPVEERIELQRVYNNYKTQMRAIKWFYNEEMIKEKSSFESASSDKSQQVEAEEWERCVAENDKWNAQIAAERETRRQKQLQEMEHYALQRMEAKDRELKERVAQASQQIRLQKEQSSTFITRETLEAAIDGALANPISYNFAIDLRGQRHTDTTPTPKDNASTAN